MVKVLALWTRPEDPDAFDADYLARHVPMAHNQPGLRSFSAAKAIGNGPYWRVGEAVFDSLDDVFAVGGSDVGRELLEDAERLQKEFGNRLDMVIVQEDEVS